MNLLAVGTNDVLLLALLALGPLMAIYGIAQLAGDLRKTSRKRIANRLRGKSNTKTDAPAYESLRKQGPKVEGVLGNMLANFKATERLQHVLDQAAMPWSAPKVLVNLTLVASVLLAGLVVAGFSLWVGLATAVAVGILPIFYFMHRRKKRLNRLLLQLPDVFELLSQALRAGHSLDSGIQVIANELPDPAGTEFARVFHEQNLGLKIDDALLNLAQRMDVLDVRFFVTAVLIQRQTGGDLAEVLDKISFVIRDRIKLHGTVLALTAEGRLSGAVLLALPVVVFCAMLKVNYEYAEMLWAHPTGQMMSMGAIVSMIMGWLMIKKIVNIKV
jgi:tight adherence protein B